MNPATLRRAFQRIVREAGADGVRLQDLRHAHATVLLCQGILSKVVQERPGHSVVSVTLGVYNHVVPGLQEHATAAFADALTNTGP
ncbi:MAG: tyrosine-type recombinase/integrase [Chloroflexi bacterium]|nr:tyrosine-type recombinase/integrase [Chloroflexota bacterium]